MGLSESEQHKEIKETISKKLKEWTGATLQEYPSSGHELDVFAVTRTGISIYVEIIWSSSKTNFFRDMSMVQESDANVKLVVVNPKIINNEEFQRHFEKVAISQRRLNFAMHGDFVDGERILNEPDYLEAEFKNILFNLLSYVETRGKTVGVQAEVEPPKPRAAVETEELLLSNLFPVRRYPETIFVSPTDVRYTREVYEKLGRDVEKIPFLPKNKKLYTFDDLGSSSPFLPIISKNEISVEKVADWVQDSVKRNDLVYLFNLGLRKYCESRGLYYEDRRYRRFVCLLDNGRTNFFTWKRGTRFVPRRIAAFRRGKEGNVLYCRHYAASLEFMFLDDEIFLKVEPTMTFTYDGYRPIRSPKLASLMSRYLSKQYNSAYLDLVRFWGKFLSKLDVTISIPLGKDKIEVDSNPMTVSLSVGFGKEGSS